MFRFFRHLFRLWGIAFRLLFPKDTDAPMDAVKYQYLHWIVHEELHCVDVHPGPIIIRDVRLSATLLSMRIKTLPSELLEKYLTTGDRNPIGSQNLPTIVTFLFTGSGVSARAAISFTLESALTSNLTPRTFMVSQCN